MRCVLFILNFLINWFLIFIVVAFGLQYLNASWTYVAVTTTAVLVGSILFFLTSHGSWILRISIPHRELNQRELHCLEPILRTVLEKANLKKHLLVFMQDNKYPNAMVVGDTLIITTGLIEIASQHELEAVLAHECGHIVNGDVILTTLNYATSKMSDIILAVGMGLVSLLSFNGRIGILYLPYFIIACVLRFIRWVLLKILDANLMAIQRKYEFRADSFAVSLGYKEDTLSYLRKINNISSEPIGIINKIFSTHPAINKRIKAIEAI